MKTKQVGKLNNKGLTLVELLAALAVSGIVLLGLGMLIIQGVNNYRKQTVTAQIQNDANIALNQMSDNFMEATLLTVNNSGGNTVLIQTQPDLYYILYEGTIYLSETSDKSDGSVLCENVTELKLDVISPENLSEYNNEKVVVQISLKLDYLGQTRQVSRVVSIRNQLESFTIN